MILFGEFNKMFKMFPIMFVLKVSDDYVFTCEAVAVWAVLYGGT